MPLPIVFGPLSLSPAPKDMLNFEAHPSPNKRAKPRPITVIG